MNRLTVLPATRVEGSMGVPADKSISHRAVLLAAVGEGDCLIRDCAPGAAVASTISCVRSLGASLRRDELPLERQSEGTSGSPWQILVEGRGFDGLNEAAGPLDCGNSGTTMRTLAGLVAGRPFRTELIGDWFLSRRPMERVAEPLRLMGAGIQTTDGHAPLSITGATLSGVDYELSTPSSLVKTAILIAGLQASGQTSVVERTPTRDHTERLLEYMGIHVGQSPHRLVVKSTRIRNPEWIEIPGDLSSAAFLLVAAAILPGSDLTITECGVNPRRAGFLDVLRRFGADVSIEGKRNLCGEPRAELRVRAADRRPIVIGREDVPDAIDELPLVAVLGALAPGETVVDGAQELRVKESDRIDAICTGLAAMGADIRAHPGGFTVRGGRPLIGTEVDSAGDHRIGMALAIAGLAATGPTSISGWNAVAVSYPSFERDLAAVTVPGPGG
ncbi:MAG: 3-phosphoshikimate 1-carboxyvinyltransferase [Actinomycetota bacterium]